MARLGVIVNSAGFLFLLAGAAQPAAGQMGAPVSSPICALAITPASECFRELDSRALEINHTAWAPDHRYEGMAIGGGLGVVGGLILGSAICGLSEDPDTSGAGCVIAGGLGMGVLAGFVGMMIGAQFPKETAARDSALSDSTVVRPDSTD
jgi:hypothetical protein